MNNSENNFDRIEAYLLNLMTAAERQAFELELQQNPELNQELKLQKAEHLAMELMLKADLRQALRETALETTAQQDIPAPKLQKTFNTRRIMQWAAAAMVVLAIGVWYLMPGNDPYAAFEGAASYRSGAAALPAVLQPAAKEMQGGRYREALAILAQTQDSTWDENIRLMRGECHFNLRELAQAETLFREILSNPQGSSNQQQAEFDLMLVLWAKGDKAAARTIREKILTKTGHQFKAKTEQLSF